MGEWVSTREQINIAKGGGGNRAHNLVQHMTYEVSANPSNLDASDVHIAAS